jgi:hypothetical protein
LADLKGDVVPNLERGYAGTHGSDDAGRFVAQGQGLAHQNVAVAEVAEVVQVRATETCSLDGHLDVIGAERRQLSFLLKGVCELKSPRL